MAWWDQKVEEFLAAVTRGTSGVKLGPGVLGTVVPIITIGIVALAAVVFSLSSNPLVALLALVIGLLFLAYAVERAFRYAEKNPIPALAAGTELVQLVRDQMGAKDKTIISENDLPVVGSSKTIIESGL